MMIDKVPRALSNIVLMLNGSNLTDILFLARDRSGDVRGTFKNVITNLITSPATYALYAICAYNMIYRKKRAFTMIVIILMVVGIFTNGGRSLLIYFGISLTCTYSFSHEDAAIRVNLKRFLRKRKKYFKWVVAVGIIFFMSISYLRSGQQLLKNSYYYFAMQPTMFEQWAEVVDQKKIIRIRFGFV